MSGIEPCYAPRAARREVELLTSHRVQCASGLSLHPKLQSVTNVASSVTGLCSGVWRKSDRTVTRNGGVCTGTATRYAARALRVRASVRTKTALTLALDGGCRVNPGSVRRR